MFSHMFSVWLKLTCFRSKFHIYCWRQQILAAIMDFFFDILWTINEYYLPTKFQVNWVIQTEYNLAAKG